MNQTHIVETRDLKRSYKVSRHEDYEAVSGVNLGIRRGELFALLGTNGSGKTSIMEMLEGHVPASGGMCTVLGLDPFLNRRRVRPRTGIVLQEGSLQGDLTVKETVRMWSGTLTTPRPCEEVLELVDLRHRGAVPVNRLSGGERRRLDFALAIQGQPEVLFLDEPTTGLDPESRARTHDLVRNLLDSGTTVVLTTHYLQEAEDLADRLAILHEGVVVASGTPSEIVAAAPSRISFALPPGAPDLTPDIPTHMGIHVREQYGSRRRIVVTAGDMQAALNVILSWASRNDLTLDDLEARPASLEQTFLTIAGSQTHDRTQGGSV